MNQSPNLQRDIIHTGFSGVNMCETLNEYVPTRPLVHLMADKVHDQMELISTEVYNAVNFFYYGK